MLKWSRKSLSFEVGRTGQSPKCLLFSLISLFLSCCALCFPISIEIPSQNLSFCEPISTEARGGKGLLGHLVALLLVKWGGVSKVGREVFPLICFQVTTVISKVKPSIYLYFLLSINGTGHVTIVEVSSIIIWIKFWGLIMNLRSVKETKCW